MRSEQVDEAFDDIRNRSNSYTVPRKARKRASAMHSEPSLASIGKHMKSKGSGIMMQMYTVKQERYPKSMRGLDICDWLVRVGYDDSISAAIERGNKMIQSGIISCVSSQGGRMKYASDTFYVFVDKLRKAKSPSEGKSFSLKDALAQLAESAAEGKSVFLSTLSRSTRQIAFLTVIISYGCGYFNMGISSALLLFVSWCFYMNLSEKIESIQRFQHLDDQAIERDEKGRLSISTLMQRPPPWVQFPDIERALWLNRFVEQMWDNGLSKATEVAVQELLDWKLNELRPSMLRDLKTIKCDFTHLRPKFEGVKVFRRAQTMSRDSVTMDVDLQIASSEPQSLIVAATMLTGTVNVAVGNIVVRGKVRLVFRQPWEYFMPFRVLDISFVGLPHIDFSLCALTQGFDLNKIGGVRSTISGLVKSSLEDMMVFPKAFPYEMFDPLFEASLRIAIVDIYCQDSVDAYCKIYVADANERITRKFSTIRNRATNVDEEFKFVVNDPNVSCRLELWSAHRFIGGSKMMGFIPFTPLKDIVEGTMSDAWWSLRDAWTEDATRRRKKKKKGGTSGARIHVKCRWQSTKQDLADGTESVSSLPASSKTGTVGSSREDSASKTREIDSVEISAGTKDSTGNSARARRGLVRKDSTLLNQTIEDKYLQCYSAASRIAEQFKEAKITGAGLVRWLVASKISTSSDEARSLCEDLIEADLIWDKSYATFKRGRRVLVKYSLGRRSESHDAGDKNTGTSSKISLDKDNGSSKRPPGISVSTVTDQRREGLITAIGVEGSERYYVVTFAANSESGIPEEKVFPLAALRPADPPTFNVTSMYCLHAHVRFSRVLSARMLQESSLLLRDRRFISRLRGEDARRHMQRYAGIVFTKDSSNVCRALGLISDLCVSTQMKMYLTTKLSVKQRRSETSSFDTAAEGSYASEFFQRIETACERRRRHSPNDAAKMLRCLRSLLRCVASFDEGIGFFRYWTKPIDLIAISSLNCDPLTSTLASNAMLQRLTAWKAISALELSVPVLCGYLERKTRKKASWRKRWFVIATQCLYEYTNDSVKGSTKQHLHRKTYLAGCVAVQSTLTYKNDFGRYSKTFELHIPYGKKTEEVMYFTAQDDEKTQQWILALERVISDANTQCGVRSVNFVPQMDPASGRMLMQRQHAKDIQRVKSYVSDHGGRTPSGSDNHILRVDVGRGVEGDDEDDDDDGLVTPPIPRHGRDRSGVVSGSLSNFSDIFDSESNATGDEEDDELSNIDKTLADRKKSSSFKFPIGMCAKCGRKADNHSRACVVCGRSYCVKCKKTEMQKIRAKTWRCFRDCAKSPTHRMAALCVSDEEDAQLQQHAVRSIGGRAKEKVTGSLFHRAMKLGRRLNKFVGLRETQRLNMREYEHLHLSNMIHPHLNFFKPIVERAGRKKLHVVYRVHAARLLLHIFYYEYHKVEKADYPLWYVTETLETALDALRAYLISLSVDTTLRVIPPPRLAPKHAQERYRRMRHLYLILELNRFDVLDMYAMARIIATRTQCMGIKDMNEFDESLNLSAAEVRFVALCEANYAAKITITSLDKHYKKIIQLRQKIMRECRSMDRVSPELLMAPRNSSRKKKRKGNFDNERRKSVYHALKFASVHEDLRRATNSQDPIEDSNEKDKLVL